MAEDNQRFDSFNQWLDKAPSWLTRHPDYEKTFFRAVCFDNTGKICWNGGDFDEATYPVHWVWPDQNLFERIDAIRKETENAKLLRNGT